MKVIISGCGRVGTAILESLLKEEHQITVIDLNPNILSYIFSFVLKYHDLSKK